uniref:Uncharacterized protein n=1 Tax=Oryza glumipatula TaxID=40148 RepID=A0A0E0B7Q6_9ORYZ
MSPRDLKQSTVLDYAIYWLVEGRTQIIEFELDTNTIALLRTPVDLPDFLIFPMEDGRLGYAGMMGPIIKVFSINVTPQSGTARRGGIDAASAKAIYSPSTFSDLENSTTPAVM